MTDVPLREAYERWASDLVAFAMTLVGPADAADVVSESFAVLLDEPHRWLQAEQPRSFLFGVVANRARMRMRSAARRRDRELVYERVELAVVPASLEGGFTSGEARRALQRLSVQQRTFVYLAYWEDWSVGEIAGHIGVSDGTVRKQLARARATLREEWS